MHYSLVILFLLNVVFVLFPVISPSRDPSGLDALFYDQVMSYGQLLSSVMTPLLVAATVAFATFDTRRRPVVASVFVPAAAVCLLMLTSAAVADTIRVETLFMGLFFLLFTVYLLLMQDHGRPGADTVLRLARTFLAVWMLAPLVAMLLDPSLFDMFFTLTVIDVSYHGFANSRVGYGLWISVLILLLGRPRNRLDWFLMIVAVVTLLLSQSRAAIFGLLLGVTYLLVRERRRGSLAIGPVVLLLSACAAALALWSTFGRDDALTFVSEDRGFILSTYLEFIERNWLFGYGSMYLPDISAIDKLDVPAHNFVLQTIANYGVLTLVAFLAYFVCVFRVVRSSQARMLLIFLFVYSMNQPVQGTGNFFNPITLLFFLIAFAVDIHERRAARSGARLPAKGRGEPGHTPGHAASHA
jgi:hypothetical protein